jgi:hypothetical protein
MRGRFSTCRGCPCGFGQIENLPHDNMPHENQTATKERSQRIPLDYFRRKLPLERWKQGLTLLAVAAAAGYVAWSMSSGSAIRQTSPGRLAAAHAMWNDHCEVCHQPFVPTSANAWSDDPHAADQLCRNCHLTSALADHSANQVAADVQSCAACHRDHRGASADLTSIADAACTRCHVQIKDHMKQPAEMPIANVTSFATDHPEFHSAKRSSSDITFSHCRHLLPGLLPVAPMRLEDLDAADRDRYRQSGQSDDQPITLVCASCHRLDRSSDTAAKDSISANQSGDYMHPISYDRDCKACHQLTYIGREDPTRTTGSKPETVPHGWTGERLRRYVEQVLDARFINESDRSLQSTPLSDAMKQPLEKWRLPNRRPQANQPQSTVGEYLDAELKVAVKNLRLECSECHQMKSDAENLDIEPVTMHPTWLAHAQFSHVAHRKVECRSCHAGALPKDGSAAQTVALDTGEPFLPDRKTCLECHSPLRDSQAGAAGGAPFDCILCHRYHDVDNPWHGRGNAARAAGQRVTIPEFIRGQSSLGKPLPAK